MLIKHYKTITVFFWCVRKAPFTCERVSLSSRANHFSLRGLRGHRKSILKTLPCSWRVEVCVLKSNELRNKTEK